MKFIENIVYCDTSDEEQYLDLYLPKTESFSVFTYFHGGGLECGDKAQGKRFFEYLVDCGIAVVSANYRMYPSARYPDFVRDAAAAVKWVFDNIGEYGNCERVYVGGSSAGGYLSMMLCFDERWLGEYGIDPASVSGWIHDAGQPTAHFNVLRERGIDSHRVIIDESAPLYHIGEQKKHSPMLFIVSDNDIPNRYEQTLMTLATMKHFELDEGAELLLMKGSHCAYVGRLDEDRKSVFGKIIEEFINKQP